ncbi:hypothetical protein [Teredinibacter sp. KSP-S5-2]|uniref:hypothetical protein n=1 Tax=Teredinibacter sp. KSP-S5-2 TaxID=3034506 RepID=UPI002934F51A|nr:hypothetical protein [Teredinibacter sp. KSP-S5-2]WNO09351.1 hypothetical protein P5V12_20625 [Teredinibacter sp. KSP-S5-2]
MKIVLFILAFISINAFADCDASGCTGVTITRIVVTPGSGTLISTSGDESKLTCDATSKGYIALNPADSNYNATYALILAAHTTKHPMWIRTNDGTGSCVVQYVVSDM